MWTVTFFIFWTFRCIEAKSFTIEIRQTSKVQSNAVSSEFMNSPTAFNSPGTGLVPANETGTHPFHNLFDTVYTANITLGTPGQNFSVQMDTGSSYLWVVDNRCTTDFCNGQSRFHKRNKFNPLNSTSFNQTNQKFMAVYAAGAVNGTFVKDKLGFGGFTVALQSFGLANEVDSVLGTSPIDGIFGMAFASLSEGVIPPINNILSQLDKPIFTVFMGKLKDPSSGRITYGDLDSTFCSDDVSYVPLSEAAFWQFNLTKASWGSFTYQEETEMQAISDTGTSFIIPPLAVWDRIERMTSAILNPADGFYYLPCAKVFSIPPIQLTIAGKEFDIPADQFVVDSGNNNGICVLTFVNPKAIGQSDSYWLLGDPWIRSWCQVHDIEKERIGFALPKQRQRSNSALLSIWVSFVIVVTRCVF